MTIKDLSLSKSLLDTIADFKFSIGSKVQETGVKFTHCTKEDFDRVFKPLFIEFGFKIFKTYWKEFDIEESLYPNKELYKTLVSVNSGASVHYFHNSLLLKITDIIIDSILVGKEDYLYNFSDFINYDSESLYTNKYRNLYYELVNDEDMNQLRNTIETSKKLSKAMDMLAGIASHGSFLLRDISQASYYNVQNEKLIESFKEEILTDDEINELFLK